MKKFFTNKDIQEEYEKLTRKTISISQVNKWIRDFLDKDSNDKKKQYLSERQAKNILQKKVSKKIKKPIDIDSIFNKEDILAQSVREYQEKQEKEYRELERKDIFSALNLDNLTESEQKKLVEYRDIFVREQEAIFSDIIRKSINQLKTYYFHKVIELEFLGENYSQLSSDIETFLIERDENRIFSSLVNLDNQKKVREIPIEEYQKQITLIKENTQKVINRLQYHPERYFERSPEEYLFEREYQKKVNQLKIDKLFKDNYEKYVNFDEKGLKADLHKSIQMKLNHEKLDPNLEDRLKHYDNYFTDIEI